MRKHRRGTRSLMFGVMSCSNRNPRWLLLGPQRVDIGSPIGSDCGRAAPFVQALGGGQSANRLRSCTHTIHPGSAVSMRLLITLNPRRSNPPRKRLWCRFVALAVALSAATVVSQAPIFDHAPFDRLLSRHVVNGRVDYDAFAAAPEFRAYLATLAAFDPMTLDRDEALAFWINAYNAYTIQLINLHGERRSIRNINKSFGFVKAYGPWNERLAVVGGKAYGLDEIEQNIIRPTYQEPRIHFALVCAAVGCPPLRSEAYVGARLDSQLEQQGRQFLTMQPDKNRVDLATRTVYLSPIFLSFRDYRDDFGGSQAAIGAYVARFFPDGPEKELLRSGKFRVRETVYDWTLNSRENGANYPAN